MKKYSLLFVSLMTLLSCCFTSCETGKYDDLKGVWQCINKTIASGSDTYWENIDITYTFDGKGNYTYKIIAPEYGICSARGTYVNMENSSLVRLHGIFTNKEGISSEYDADLWLNTINTPYTLRTTFIDVDYPDVISLIFEKQ